MDAFVEETQKTVTGTVKVKLYKGSATAAALPVALFPLQRRTGHLGADEIYNQKDAEGFLLKFFGLPLTVLGPAEPENLVLIPANIS